MPDFVTDLLNKINAPTTPTNKQFLNAWTWGENTKARFNPLATTQPAPGSYALPGNAAINNGIAVQQYRNYQQGLDATVQTILGKIGNYGPIVAGLRAGNIDPAELARRVAASQWGTGSGVSANLSDPTHRSTMSMAAFPQGFVPSGATTVPAGTPAPFGGAAPAATPPIKSTAPDFRGAVLGSLGQGPAALTNALIFARVNAPKTVKTPGGEVPLPPHAQQPAGTNTTPGVPPTKGNISIVDAAKKWLGTDYSWGGGGPAGPSYGSQQGAGIKGFDCSSLLQYACAKVGIKIDRVTYDQWNQGQAVGVKALRPGDAVFFNMGRRGPEHVGIYMGQGKFIEAPHTGAQVRISSLASRSDFVGARRYG